MRGRDGGGETLRVSVDPGAAHAARCASLRARDGQSTIEVLGAIPLLLVIVLACAQLLAAGATRVSASSAAAAAAMALVQGGDPVDAARSAAPGWTHIAVRTTGRHVRVRLTPPNLLPGLSGLLRTTAEADAGPAPAARAAGRLLAVAPALAATGAVPTALATATGTAAVPPAEQPS